MCNSFYFFIIHSKFTWHKTMRVLLSAFMQFTDVNVNADIVQCDNSSDRCLGAWRKGAWSQGGDGRVPAASRGGGLRDHVGTGQINRDKNIVGYHNWMCKPCGYSETALTSSGLAHGGGFQGYKMWGPSWIMQHLLGTTSGEIICECKVTP